MSKNNLFFQKRGQGILEVVIAISVVVIGLVSVISLAVFNINVQGYNHNMLVASNLAREGVEVVRNIRDSNWLDSEKEWDDSLFHDASIPSIDSDENTFIIFNRSARENDNFDYDIFPVGMTWKNCIDENYSVNLGTYAACRLSTVPILRDNDIEIYNYGRDVSGNLLPGSQVSNFYRIIYINEICSSNGEEKVLTGFRDRCRNNGFDKIGLQVISKVGWNYKGSVKTIEVEERLYDWK